jgi:HK97 family phage major capsid protein
MAEFAEVKDLIEAQAKARKAEIEVLENEQKKSRAEVDAALAKIDNEFVELRKQALEIEKKAGRPDLGSDKQEAPERAEHRKAFERYLRKGDSSNLEELQTKAMTSSSDPSGGYLILPEMDAMIDRVVPKISAMYRLANTVTIGTNQYQKLVKVSGLAMRRVAEGGTGGETTAPTYSKLLIDVHPAEVEPWVHNETLEDAFINLESDLAQEAAVGFAEGAGAEFITGNGVGKARGITAYDNVANASFAWGKVGYIASGKSAAFASVAPADAIVRLQHSLKAQYRPGAVWLMNDATLATARQMKDGSGSYYLWQPDPLGAFGGRFLGHAVEIDDNMQDVGAGSFSVAFGDMSRAYTIVNRAGTSIIRDNITAKGTTKFNFRRRFGGGITNFEAIKLMKFATS